MLNERTAKVFFEKGAEILGSQTEAGGHLRQAHRLCAGFVQILDDVAKHLVLILRTGVALLCRTDQLCAGQQSHDPQQRGFDQQLIARGAVIICVYDAQQFRKDFPTGGRFAGNHSGEMGFLSFQRLQPLLLGTILPAELQKVQRKHEGAEQILYTAANFMQFTGVYHKHTP